MTRRACLLALALVGCDAQLAELSVDVRTDLGPGTEFQRARVELVPEHGLLFDAVEVEARAGDPYAQGVRVADFTGVPVGRTVRVRAALLDSSGAELVARRVELVLEADYALSVVLTRDCAGRVCPSAGEPASFTECLSGRCVDARCGGPRPRGCGDLACTTGSECAGRLDCTSACVEGACVCAGIADAGLDAGPEDAGPCPGECAAGESGEETRICGECGEGLERRTRSCGADCRWGPFASWGACETSAQCSPGETDTEPRACGNCGLGTQARTRGCGASCTWLPFGDYSSCAGGGACASGATRAGCDPCGHQVCTSSCTWGSCQPAPGAECLRIRPGTSGPPGNNWRCCGAGRWQFCLDTCRWSPECDSCSGCSC